MLAERSGDWPGMAVRRASRRAHRPGEERPSPERESFTTNSMAPIEIIPRITTSAMAFNVPNTFEV
jgi:hypothetical protein